MTQIVIALILLCIIFTTTSFLLFKALRKEIAVSTKLQNELTILRHAYDELKNIERDSNEQKEQLKNNSVNDAVANSFNILRNIKESKHSSKS